MNEIETVKLENGLTIYLYEDKRKHTCIFDIITKFGGMSKDYKIDNKVYHFQDGIAHILEHFLVECNCILDNIIKTIIYYIFSYTN